MNTADKEEMETWLQQLRDEGTSMYECMRKVSTRYHLPLLEAGDAVVLSRAWESEREAHDKMNAEFFEGFADLENMPDEEPARQDPNSGSQ